MKWMKQFASGGKAFETTRDNAEMHLKDAYKNIKKVLDELSVGQKIRNPFAYYWKEA